MHNWCQYSSCQQLSPRTNKGRKKSNLFCLVNYQLVVTIAGNKWNLLPIGPGRTWQISVFSSISYICRTSGSRNQNKCLTSSMAKNEASSGCSNFRVGMKSLNHTRTVLKSAESWRGSGEDTGEANIYFMNLESTV